MFHLYPESACRASGRANYIKPSWKSWNVGKICCRITSNSAPISSARGGLTRRPVPAGRARVEMGAGRARDKKCLCVGNWMLTQCTWKWPEQEIQCYRELAIQGYNNILQWWRDHRLEFSVLSDVARNTFGVMATSAANERVFSMVVQWACREQQKSKFKGSVSERHTLFRQCFWSWKEALKGE